MIKINFRLFFEVFEDLKFLFVVSILLFMILIDGKIMIVIILILRLDFCVFFLEMGVFIKFVIIC